MNTAILAADDPAWGDCLQALRHDVYHRACYVASEAARDGAVAEAFVARDGERTFFVPYLVRRCADLFPGEPVDALDATSPHGYAGPLLSPAARDAGFASAALQALRDALRARGRVSAFLRMHPILNDGDAALYPPGTVADLGPSVAIDLAGDEAALWAQMRDKHRESVRRAQRMGYAPAFEPLADAIDAFRAVYDETMDRVDAKDAYRFPREYYEDLARRPDTFCCVVRRDDRIVAGCLFFECGGIVQAHLGGTLTAELAGSPFMLALHHASAWGQRRGDRWLHLGGGVGGAKDGVLRFKAGFSPARFRMGAVRLVADEAEYARLVALRERALGTPGALAATGYFPAYRAA